MSASIKSIYVEDFQSHANTKIELAPAGGLTVLCGATDSGKTAIVRALRLLMYNTPQGSDYIRVGRDRAAVAVEMRDGTKVARERSKGVNRYRVTKPGEGPSVFEGFGANVPLEIQQATGVRNVIVGDLELALNLSEQLDGPFLGNKSISGPARAKVLGKLAGTEEVDEAQRALGTDLHRAGQEEKRLAGEVEALDAGIREYDYLPALAERITALESLLEVVKRAQERLAALESAKSKLESIRSQVAESLRVLARWAGLSQAAYAVSNAETDHIKAQSLARHREALIRLAEEQSAWARLLSRWDYLRLAEMLTAEADAAHSRATSLVDLSDTLSKTLAGLTRVRAVLKWWAGLQGAMDVVAECSVTVARVDSLKTCSAQASKLRVQIAEASRARTRWGGLEDANEAMIFASTNRERLSALLCTSDSITKTRHAKILAENDLDRFSKMLADTQTLYTDSLVNMGKCPLCGSKVDPSCIKEVA